MPLQRAVAIAVLSALAFGSAIGRTDDATGSPPPAGFLEFLGSVDRLAEVNPNYLSRPASTKVARPAASATPPPSPPPPPPPATPSEKTNG